LLFAVIRSWFWTIIFFIQIIHSIVTFGRLPADQVNDDQDYCSDYQGGCHAAFRLMIRDCFCILIFALRFLPASFAIPEHGGS
jgi:hypothetical protein